MKYRFLNTDGTLGTEIFTRIGVARKAFDNRYHSYIIVA